MPDENLPIPRPGRHRAIVRITDEVLYCVLVGLKSGRLMLPVFPDLPADARVLGVHHDFESGTFSIVLEHPSFPLVPDGTSAPRLPCVATEFRTVATAAEPAGEPDAVVG